MKKIKPFLALAAVAAVGAIVGGVEIADIMTFLFGGSGAAMAFAAVVGTPTTDTVTAAALEDNDVVDQDLSSAITQFNPDRFPLDTITRTYLKRRRKAKAQKVGYWEKGYKPLSDTLDASAGNANGQSESTAACKNTDSTLTDIWVKVSTDSTWRTKDTLRMDDVTINGDKMSVQFYVAEKSKNKLHLFPNNGVKNDKGEWLVPLFDSTTKLYRQGNAMSEKDMTVEAFAIIPEQRTQFCQNYMAVVEESVFASLTETKKAVIDLDDLELEAIRALRGEIELSSFFGAMDEIRNGSDTTLFTSGIVRNIDTILYYGNPKDATKNELTKEQYTEWMRTLFTGNSGSRERVLFAGAGLIAAISLLRETYKTIQHANDSDTSLGVKCTSIVSDFGTLKIVPAPLFNENGWLDKGVVLDLEHLEKYEFVPMKAFELDLRASGQSNVNAKVIQEVSCMVLKYPECHAIIEPAPKQQA